VPFEPGRGNAVPVFVNPQQQPCRRHYRESGNPVRSVSVISDKFLLLFISRFPLSRELRRKGFGFFR
ncbi:TPA: hypothetical protein ACMHHG_001653, partial [Neisseria gonorrhoeae]